MKRPRIAAIALCVASTVGFAPAAAVAYSALPLRAQQAASLSLTGLVLEHDGKTRVPNQRLRLRYIFTGRGAALIAAAATAGIVAVTKFGDDDSGPVSAER